MWKHLCYISGGKTLSHMEWHDWPYMLFCHCLGVGGKCTQFLRGEKPLHMIGFRVPKVHESVPRCDSYVGVRVHAEAMLKLMATTWCSFDLSNKQNAIYTYSIWILWCTKSNRIILFLIFFKKTANTAVTKYYTWRYAQTWYNIKIQFQWCVFLFVCDF